MPCYDSRNYSEYVESEALEKFRHNSPVAEMLCEVMTKITSPEEYEETYNPLLLSILSPDILNWWKEHQVRDLKKKKPDR